MARKKKVEEDVQDPPVQDSSNQALEPTSGGGDLVPIGAGYDDFMAPADRSQHVSEEAGLGSEDIDASDIILPRVKLLQSLSPEVADEEIGEVGQLWLSPHNRALSWRPDKKGDTEGPTTLKFVPIRVFPAWRRWTPKDEGGGLECEAPGGDLTARNAEGITGASLKLIIEGNEVQALEWVDGDATDSCRECVFGPAAAASAAGKSTTGKSNPWLPKLVEDPESGDMVRLPDKLRRPRCTQSLDVLALVAVPPSGEMPGTIMPAFISFSRTSHGAGKSLAGMLKMSSGEPVWSSIFELGCKKVTGEFTYYVLTVRKFGYAKRALMDQAKDVFMMTKSESYVPDMSDGEEPSPSAEGTAASAPPKDDEPAPDDDF